MFDRLKFRGKRQQGDVLRPLDRHGEPALMTRTGPGHTARQNLPALLNERRENLGLFVVDKVHFVDAEPANFLLADEVALAALGRAARTAGAAGPAWRAASPKSTPWRGTGMLL